MNFSHFFIRRPIFAAVLSIVIVLVGASMFGAERIAISSLTEQQRSILFDIRLPRVFLAACVGASLAAAGAGLDFSYISKLENGRIPPPAADTVVSLCRILKIEPQELLAACDYYVNTKHRMMTFEYILIDGVNDSLDQAHKLGAIAKRLRAKCDWTPFEGMEVNGSVERVVLRGREVVRSGIVKVEPGFGLKISPLA